MTENLETTIHDVVREIARQAGRDVLVEDRQSLVSDLGFGSMDIAQLVATLEIALDLDPFAKEVAITSIRTVGDLCDAYRRCRSAVVDPL
jgi:acyl carrier protein